ncbi:alpha/beta fold hydrolase [Saccharopolyspora hattusasensis]|uniref:alpha/beta fold hydrolase n=1 Tax=Saccharopolyspora hattusasensis TaxID=1128679 RepID=UPI003D96DCEC
MGLVAESPAADILALLDRLELPQVVLGGCSMGGSGRRQRPSPCAGGNNVVVDEHVECGQEGV